MNIPVQFTSKFFSLICFTITLALPVPQPHLSVPWETCFFKRRPGIQRYFLQFLFIISHNCNFPQYLSPPVSAFSTFHFILNFLCAHTQHLGDFIQQISYSLLGSSSLLPCSLQGSPSPPLSEASLVSSL